ncbi:MAG: hypothetical protein QCH35_09070 [Methanomicrobiaceae archaeon]|nr:hypothetical protein [Methanomicrobiaceae archaeon]
MGSFFDRLFGRKPEAPVLVLEYAEIPQWLDGREIDVRNEMIGQTAGSRTAIAHAIEEARNRVNQLRTVEFGDQTPPKLKRVVETSLQPFVRAMDITLSRHFSSDPIEFYNDAVEVLKGCMKHMKGQGKYIAAVLPEEMKELRSCLSHIGTEINKLTEEIGRAQQVMDKIREARDAYRALEEAAGECRAKGMQWKRLWKDIERDEARLTAIAEKVAGIETDTSYRAARELQARAGALEQEHRNLRERYHSIASTTGGVLRRAAYAAERQGTTESAHRIQKVMQMLDTPATPGPDILIRSVRAILPDIRAMVDGNIIVLKNKSELHLFSDDAVLIKELETICQGHADVGDEIDALNTAIAHSEPLSVMRDLKQREEAIREKHAGDIDRMATYEKEMYEIRARMPHLSEELERRIQPIVGETTRLDLRGLPVSEAEPPSDSAV